MIFEFFGITFLVFLGVNLSVRSKKFNGPRSDHFNGRKFFNIMPGKRRQSLRKYFFVGSVLFLVKKLDNKVWRKRPLPTGIRVPPERVYGKEIISTFINHSTVLIQTEGLNILTDPVWAKYISPFPFLGPKRYMDPGVALKDLPRVDIILLTHNHYDHMDIATLRKLYRRFQPKIYTTLGNGDYLARRGIPGAVEMDWGQSKTFLETVSLQCVPAQHFSDRGFTDRNRTLWSGFVIHTSHGDIYFAGDTGYGTCISHIKKMYPNGFRLGFLPIGAYEPQAIMKPVHTSPDDAVEIYKNLNIGQAVAIHFGTFALALDGQDDPVDRLSELLQKEENREVKFAVLQNGESLTT